MTKLAGKSLFAKGHAYQQKAVQQYQQKQDVRDAKATVSDWNCRVFEPTPPVDRVAEYAAQVGIHLDPADKEMRCKVKAMMFGQMYGGTPKPLNPIDDNDLRVELIVMVKAIDRRTFAVSVESGTGRQIIDIECSKRQIGRKRMAPGQATTVILDHPRIGYHYDHGIIYGTKRTIVAFKEVLTDQPNYDFDIDLPELHDPA